MDIPISEKKGSFNNGIKKVQIEYCFIIPRWRGKHFNINIIPNGGG
jgi:hypothetical protein